MKKLLILFALLPLFALAQPPAYRNLVFEGGGIRGLAYAGALEVLEEKEVLRHIEKVGGTSAGAITAMIVSLGYTPQELDSILRSLKFEQFNDGGGSIPGGIRRIKKTYGWYRGEKYERWLGDLIERKTGRREISFSSLHQLALSNSKFKDLYCTGTNITRQRVEVFSFTTTPDMLVNTAVRISGSIPIYFKPVFIDSLGQVAKKPVRGAHYDIYVDGGLISNFPITLFDSCGCTCNPLTCKVQKFNPATLGLKLERPEQIEEFRHSTEIPPYQIQSFNQYLDAFSNLLMETLNRKGQLEEEKGRTIYISYGAMGSKIKKLKPEAKQLLFDNGRKAAKGFFEGRDL